MVLLIRKLNCGIKNDFSFKMPQICRGMDDGSTPED